MSFSPSIAVGQTGTNAALVIITDNSSGSDVLIVSRLITITDNQGNPVVPDGNVGNTIAWPLVTNPISLNLLLSDKATNIRVDWLNSLGASIYDTENDFDLDRYNKNFFVYLFQQQALKPNIVQSPNYFSNLVEYYANIVGSEAMVEDAGDLSNAQNCLDRATEMKNNESKLFR